MLNQILDGHVFYVEDNLLLHEIKYHKLFYICIFFFFFCRKWFTCTNLRYYGCTIFSVVLF